eukprot:403335145
MKAPQLLVLFMTLGFASLVQISPNNNNNKLFLQLQSEDLKKSGSFKLVQSGQVANTTTGNSTQLDVIIVDDDIDEDLVVSERIVQKAEEGKHFFFLMSDRTSVWAYDPVTNLKSQKIVGDRKNIRAIDIDKERNYLYVADMMEGNNKSVVMKYHLKVNSTNKNDIKITVLPNSTFKVYDGDRVTGIAVDDVKHFLFIAESDRQSIIKIDFTNIYNPLGNATVLYSGLPSLQNLQGVVCDEEHELLFWGNSQNGAKIGGVLQANYSGMTQSTSVLNTLDVISDISYEDDQLYYIVNGNEIYTQDHEANNSKPILVNKGFFTNAYRISALDGYIYVTDEKMGLYLIKTFDDPIKPFDEPVKLEFGSELKGFRAFTILKTSGGIYQIMVGITTLALSLAMFMF